MYLKRHAEKTIDKLAKMFGAVIVSGPRQVGKTTLLKEKTKGIKYVTLDDPIIRMSASEQSNTFLKDNPPPVFIDEVQYAPQLFPYIKMILDEEHKKGQFFLSGSQQFELMKNVSESLAGRIGITNLLGLSMREIKQTDFCKPFIPEENYFRERQKECADITYDDVWNYIHRGNMPELCCNDDMDWQIFYGSYVQTYIERDVKQLTQVGNENTFSKFMTALAANTGQLLNLASAARDVGISQPTAARWLSVLCTSGIVYLLKPYSNNILKRVTKTPKLYFTDTGLAAYLTRWSDADMLKNGVMAGAFFENFVVAEILKSYYNNAVTDPPLYYYRDKDMHEIDLIIEQNSTLYPVEIKKHADPTKKDIAAFRYIDNIPSVKRGPGGVVCMYENLVSIQENDRVIPVKYL